MRVKITADSVATEELRELLAALSIVRGGDAERATVGLNGPECWSVETPHLTPREFAGVVGRLVKFRGETLTESLLARAIEIRG